MLRVLICERWSSGRGWGRFSGLDWLAGLSGAVAVGRVMEGLLFGVRGYDPWTLIGVSILLIGVAAGACYIPALRVSRADPLSALRYE